MKSILRKLTLCALLGASTSAYAAVELIPNGDFENGATNWVQNSGAGEVTPVTFATGGNPGGYGTLTPAGGWGVLVSPDIPGAAGGGWDIVADLGLTAGSAYTFTYDSINTNGPGPVGGFKVEAWADDLLVGNSGEIFPTVIGDGSTWQTYTLVWTLPATTQKLIFVPLWAGGANTDTIGFDNIGVDNDPVAPPPVIPGIPNPGFEIPGGANWAAVGPITGFSYPTTGGNPDGYGVMDATNGEWGIWVANNDAVLTLEQLSLTAGLTYNFTMDMRLISGSSIGGFKVDFFNGGGFFDSTDDIRIATIGDGSTWQTYTYPVTIPLGTTGVKLVPLWGPSSVVGYDNVAVNTTPIVPPPFVPDQIPNGDFEIAGGANWTQDVEIGGPQISFLTTGGNPSGHAVIDATLNEGFAAIEAFGGAEKTFASLGLAPGDTFIIQLDMKILEGANIGGVRLVGPAAWEAPDLPDQRPAIIGDGSTWETYSFSITVPASPAQARFTFLWGFNSKVAYDNVMIVLPGPAGPFQATIAQGTSVSWTAASETNQYQPQQSADNSIWTNLGPAIVGNALSAVFDANTSPFYRVLESSPSVTQTVYNGNFDEEGLFPDEADGWIAVQSQLAFRLTTGGLNGVGDPCMQISVLNNTAEPNGSEIQQNTKDADALNPGAGAVIPGNSYNFSFWAKQISSGASYEQRYKISWLDDEGNILGDGGFQNFPLAVTGNWVQLTQSGLIAPAGTTTALIQILGVTGAVEGGLGEVLIDDVSLEATGFSAPTVLAAATLPAVEISWPSTTGQNYQVQSSTNLVDWPNFGGVISGNNTTKAVYDTITPPAKFYRVGELP